jgi:FtsP/CotA-like multicopper oxidase with cupredoxin domain
MISGFVLAAVLVGSAIVLSRGYGEREDIRTGCPRPPAGSIVQDAHERVSSNGVLELTLTERSAVDENGNTRYCYFDEGGFQSPTLRVRPGDSLIVHLKNEIAASAAVGAHSHHATENAAESDSNPCAGGTMNASSTNLHFHGLAVPPICHQDETLKTVIQPGDPAFEYRILIPTTQPPGLYWYHPHVHGFTEQQLLGGASGALVVEGTSTVVPAISGLQERVFVFRDEDMPASPPGATLDLNRPTKQLSINYISVPYPDYPTASIVMKPSERQLWRVLNASADTYLNLAIEYDGKRQTVSLVSLDGAPLHYGEPDADNYMPEKTNTFLVPAGRAEFIVNAPPEGAKARLVTLGVFRGADDDDGRPVVASTNAPALRVGLDDVDPTRPLAEIITSPGAADSRLSDATTLDVEKNFVSLAGVRPDRKRTLFFSERLVDPSDPNSDTLFFVTEEGHTPAIFDHTAEPDITVRQGEVEDWTIENRSREVHTFHVHQLHFLVIGRRGTAWEETSLRDTVNVGAWSGFGPYPSLTIRMDFRNPNIVGTFPFHCHIVQHEDGGMMGTVRVEPAKTPEG